MENSKIINDLKTVANISDPRKMTKDDGRRVMELAGQGRLRKEHVKFMMENFPQFIELARDSVQSVKIIAESASKSQISGIEAIKSSLDSQSKVVEKLSDCMDSDATREVVASAIVEIAKCNCEMAKTLEKMNESNNGFWKDVAKIGVVSVVAAAAVFKLIR